MEATTLTGPAKNLIEFGVRARERGVDLTVATYERPDAGAAGFTRAAQAQGLPIELIRERRAFDTGVFAQVRGIIERVRPDIVQTHNIKSHFLARALRLKKRAPWIAFHHGYTDTDLKMRLYNLVNRWSLPDADRVVTVCAAFAGQLRREGVPPERISVRHNTVRPFEAPAGSEVMALRASLGIPEAARVIFCAGRFSREKAHADLVRAVALIPAGGPEFRLVLAGDGPERPAVERLASSLGIAGSVIFCGYRSDLRPFYAMADIFALPSHSEGSPNVLLEAMAAGLPAVATAVGGVPEIAAGGETALLVPPGDAPAMAEALGALLAGREMRSRMGNAARAASAAYSPEAYCGWLLELYGEVIAAARAERVC